MIVFLLFYILRFYSYFDSVLFYYTREHNQSVCFVPNCREPKGLPLYDFPVANVRLLHTWLKRIGLSTMYDMDLYFNLKICKSHFHENCFIENSMQLKLHAVPSINLIGKYFPLQLFVINVYFFIKNRGAEIKKIWST